MSFPNVIYGDSGDQHGTSITQQHSLGTRMVLPDGRVYRYIENAATALKAGLILQAPPSTIDGASQAFTLQADALAGATSIRLNPTMDTSEIPYGDLDEGYVVFSATGSTGMGEIHQLLSAFRGGTAFRAFKGSTGSESAVLVASTNLKSWHTVTGTVVELYFTHGDKLQNAQVTDTGVVRLVKNPYKDVIVKPAVVSQIPIGVPNNVIPASYYGWAQTWGPCPVIVDLGTQSNIVRGVAVCAATEDVGAVMGAYSTQITGTGAYYEGGFILPPVGYVMEKAADTFHAVIFLTISP